MRRGGAGRGMRRGGAGRNITKQQYLTPACYLPIHTDSYATSQVFARGEIFMCNAVLFLSL